MKHRWWLLGWLLTAAVGAQEATAPPAPPPEPSPDQPGYRVRAMPTDTFKPSEKVSEDFPVAFPADI